MAANGFSHVYVGRDSLNGFSIGDTGVSDAKLASARAAASPCAEASRRAMSANSNEQPY